MDLTDRPPLAGILVRIAAVLLDGLIPGLLFAPLALVAAFALQNPTSGMRALNDPTMSTILVFLVLLTYAAVLSYSALVLAMWAYGLTPGKWMLGIRVIKSDTGVPVGFWRMALRQVIGQWVSAVVCYLGYIWALFDANRQGWHDKIAKTLVIRTR